jgi:1A family penicillin-binding protein
VSLLRKRSQIFLVIIVIILFILLGIPVGIILGYWNRLPSLDSLEYENKSWQFPSKVFSDVAYIYPKTSYEKLIQRLERLDYQTVDAEPTNPGEFYLINSESSDTNEIRLYLRHLKYPRLDREPMFVVIRTDKGNITAIKNKDGLPLNEFILEPEAIDEFYGGEGIDREIITLSQVTDDLRNAFIAIEDKRFYRHIGIDPYRIMAAIIWDIKHNTREQGGSTITQQLARDLFLTRERIVTRKIKEWLMAIRIERKYTKDEILERYLNRVNLGRVGSREIYGVEQASKYYFGKHAWELSIPECATLAGIPKHPPRYSPIKNPENSKARRQLVLKQMFDLQYISEAQYDSAIETPLVTVSMGESWSADIAYFLEYVRMELEKRFEPSALYGQGFNIYTTMDMSMQLSANSAVQKQLRIFDKSLKFPNYDENKTKWFANDRNERVENPESFIQSSLVSIEPSTGYIKAMVGGRDFSINQFNRATQAQRQPGSAFKPFVYCAAFANKLATPADVIIDAPWRIKLPDGIWEPKNFSHKYSGAVTLRTALVKSLNVPTAKLMNERVGVSKVIDLAKSMGIQSQLAHVPSLALGSSEVNVLEITSAYSVWANQGVRAEPVSVKYVIDREDNIVEENAPKTKRVLEKNVAYQMIYVMKGVVDGGTGSRIRSLGFKRPAAGKTGTTNDSTDAWFIGFVPDLTTGVWVGFDDTKSTHRTGAEAALPIWADFMKSVVEGPEKDFPVPGGVTFRSVNTVIGSDGSKSSKEAFLPGTRPKSSSSGEDDFGL